MGKKLIIFIIIIVVLGLIAGGVFFFSGKGIIEAGGCNVVETRETPVSLELAKSVATSEVNKFLTGREWAYVGYYPVYNTIGVQQYYLFIFRNINKTTSTTLESLGPEAKIQSEDEVNYQFFAQNFATIITGSMKEDSLYFRHYGFLPDSLVEKQEIKQFVESKYPGKTIGNVVYHGTTEYYEILSNGKRTDDLIRVLDNRIESSSDLAELTASNKKRSYDRLSGDECKQIKQAVKDRETANIAAWNGFE